VGNNCHISRDATIGAGVTIGACTRFDMRVQIFAKAALGSHVEVLCRSLIAADARVADHSRVGRQATFYPTYPLDLSFGWSRSETLSG